jgi:hypothetical protein
MGVWFPLASAMAGGQLPARPGLYRIRRVGWSGLDYLGQTGMGTMTLRKRISMLGSVWAGHALPRSPYRRPGLVGAPPPPDGLRLRGLGAGRGGTTQWRKTLEAVAITRYRLERGSSPTLNFGRMPVGYLMSSANNARLVLRGRRFRGGPSIEPSASHLPSLAPLTSTPGPSTSSGWGGHCWQPWAPLRGAPVRADSVGLYRVRDPNQAGLLYVGQGRSRTRLAAHLAKAARPDHPQARWFSTPDLACSWTTKSWVACPPAPGDGERPHHGPLPRARCAPERAVSRLTAAAGGREATYSTRPALRCIGDSAGWDAHWNRLP